jgi:hypothetical protein
LPRAHFLIHARGLAPALSRVLTLVGSVMVKARHVCTLGNTRLKLGHLVQRDSEAAG